MNKLYTKLFAIQSKSIVVTKDGKNPHYGSKFMTLDNIVETLQPFLTSESLLVTHFIENGTLTTRVVDITSGEALDSHFPMNATDPQKVGSEISYGKRYNLVAMFNLCADDDDDGNKASAVGITPKEVTPEPEKWITDENIKNLIQNIVDKKIIANSADDAVKYARKYYKVSTANAGKITLAFSQSVFQ